MSNILTYLKVRLTSIIPLWVEVDGEDQTITLSKQMYQCLYLCGIEQDNNIYMFKADGDYAFAVRPEQLKDAETNFYQIQYNEKYKTVGFCPTCPSVARILSDEQLPYDFKGRVRVRPCYTHGITYFRLKFK